MTVHQFPGHTAARNALTDPKTTPEIVRAARDMPGETAPEDLMWVWPTVTDFPVMPEQPRQYRVTPVRSWATMWLIDAAICVLIFMMGWVAGLLTIAVGL